MQQLERWDGERHCGSPSPLMQDNDQGDLQDLIFLNNEPSFNLFSANNYSKAFSDILNDLDIKCDYYTEQSLMSKFQNSQNFLGFSININSLHAKFSSLLNFVSLLNESNIKIGFICIQEIWQANLDICSIAGFNLVGVSRQHSRGGGCAIYINSEFDFEIILPDKYFIETIYESITVKITTSNNQSFILTSSYRPPASQLMSNNEQMSQFFDLFCSQIEDLSEIGFPLIFTGDFNINLLTCNDISSQFLDILSFYALFQLSTKATRIINGSNSLIDFILSNDVNLINDSGILIDSPSDHFINFCSLSFSNPARNVNYRLARNFSEENTIRFVNIINDLTWESTIECNGTNLACDIFLETFESVFDLCFPLKKYKIRSSNVKISYLTRGLKISRKTCLKLHRKAKIRPTFINKNRYKVYRNLYNKLLRIAKRDFYREKTKKAGNDSKKLWNIIKNASNFPQKDNKISSIIVNEFSFNSDGEIADQFNSHFTSLGDKAKAYIPSTYTDFREFLPDRIKNTFFLRPISVYDMFKYILSISPKSSTDINGYSMKLLHKVAASISLPLSHIYNLSCEQGIFPDSFKISKVIPIHKSNEKSNMNNYRGISLINTFSKVFEKIMSTRLSIFLEENSFFYIKQFGFRQHHSTQHAILNITNFVTKAINNGQFALMLSFDVYKCFDILAHNILFVKLEHYGVRGVSLEWFKSYFKNRKQKVLINSTFSSNFCQIEDGVLQGSVIGVLLFLIYINDLCNCSKLLEIILFADDNNSLLANNDIQSLISTANEEIEKLKQWYSSNRLAIHPLKSKFILFHPDWMKLNLPIHNNEPYIPLFLNLNDPDETNLEKLFLLKGVPNPSENSLKTLGIFLDKNLNMKSHVEYLQGTISRSIFNLKIMKNLLDKRHLKLLYNSYVHSHIIYSAYFLSMCSDSTLNPLIKLQKKAIRAICNMGYREHTAPLFKSEQILPIKLEIKFQSLSFMHAYNYLRLPAAFNNIWIKNSNIAHYRLRNAEDFNIPNVRYVYLFKHPLYIFPRIWNELNLELRNTACKISFGSMLKEALFSQID